MNAAEPVMSLLAGCSVGTGLCLCLGSGLECLCRGGWMGVMLIGGSLVGFVCVWFSVVYGVDLYRFGVCMVVGARSSSGQG